MFINREGEAAYARLLDTLEARHLGPKDHLPSPPPEPQDVYGQPDDCPFPGQPAFDERYDTVYLGRERQTQVFLEELRQMRSRSDPRLLMIVVGSGSGKSSLLMAGVLPRLKHTTSSHLARLAHRNLNCRTVTFTPDFPSIWDCSSWSLGKIVPTGLTRN